MSGSGVDLIEARIDRVIGMQSGDHAVVVRAQGKAFLIFVGQSEAYALMRELKGVHVSRPIPYDVITNIFTGFDIEVRMVVVSSIVNNVFCATLMLTQETGADQRNEVRLDLRASDAMIIALKCGRQLYVTPAVLDQVQDVTAELPDPDELGEGGPEGP